METPERFIYDSSSSSSSLGPMTEPVTIRRTIMSLGVVYRSPPVLDSPFSHTRLAGHQDELNTDRENDLNRSVVAESCGSKQESAVNTNWLGSSQFFLETCLELQKEKGYLKAVISRREQAVLYISTNPYNPALFLELSNSDFNLGYHDIAVANALKAILLVEAAQDIGPSRFPRLLKAAVQKSVTAVIQSSRQDILHIELEDVHRKAYRALLNGLLGCGCFFDGLKIAKKALLRFPGDHELLELRGCLKNGFKDRMEGFTDSGATGEGLKALTRWGKIMVVPYPWLDRKLNMRMPKLVKQINKHFGVGSCEVSPVTLLAAGNKVDGVRSQDVGPLGVVAIRDIRKGELVLVDESITGVSVQKPSQLKHCDACHATLQAPYQLPHETIKTTCCSKVAYCSLRCFTTATNGYHKILCGKDFDWVYEGRNTSVTNVKYGGGTRWRPIMFLRIIAIILADRSNGAPCHPLQHPLVARMAANYSHTAHPNNVGFWQYAENVETPTKILMALGIDVFYDQDFTPEVITTIYWRLENNANMSITNIEPRIPITADLPETEYEKANEEGSIYMVCLNPHYIFFNHSCEPNVSWHGAIPDPSVDISWLQGVDGILHKVGCSTVFCYAARDIKKGEELKISYIGDPMGGKPVLEESAVDVRAVKREALTKWFFGGCGCNVCEQENAAKKVQNELKDALASGSGGDHILKAI